MDVKNDRVMNREEATSDKNNNDDDSNSGSSTCSSNLQLLPVIGLRMQEPYVDIISELHPTFKHVLSRILSYCGVKQLRVMCCVSKTWKYICQSDSKAYDRRMRALKKIRRRKAHVGQENWPEQKKPCHGTGYIRPRNAFNDIGNVNRHGLNRYMAIR